MAEYDDVKYTNGYYDNPNGYDEEEEEEDQTIQSEDCWKVIGSFFATKGLVAQQIDSFNEFMRSTMQDLINEHGAVALDQAVPSYDDEPNPVVIRRHEVKFGNISLSSPNMTEGDGTTTDMLPHEARLRSLTYSSAVYLNMQRKLYVAKEAPWADQMDDQAAIGADGQELYWQEEDLGEEGEPMDVFLGKIPIMLKSATCHLLNKNRFPSDRDLHAWGECPYDQEGTSSSTGVKKS